MISGIIDVQKRIIELTRTNAELEELVKRSAEELQIAKHTGKQLKLVRYTAACCRGLFIWFKCLSIID